MKNYLFWLSMILMILWLCSCATVGSGSSTKVEITSQPQNAKVIVYDENQENINEFLTPYIMNLNQNEIYHLEILHEGYQTATYTLKPKFRKSYLANFFAIIGGGVLFTLYKESEKTKYDSRKGAYYIEESNNFYATRAPGIALASLGAGGAILDHTLGNHKGFPPKLFVYLGREPLDEEPLDPENIPLEPIVPSLVQVNPIKYLPEPEDNIFPRRHDSWTDIEVALQKALFSLKNYFPPQANISIHSTQTNPADYRTYIAGEITIYLLKLGHQIVNSTRVNDLGWDNKANNPPPIKESSLADYIISYQIEGTGSNRRLNLKAIDSKTETVLGTASEKF